MQTIRKQDAKVAALTGKQQTEEGLPLRITEHSVTVPCEEGTLLFHCMTKELLLLSGQEMNSLMTDASLRELLAEKWFLVPDGFSEKQFADEVRSAMEVMNPPVKKLTVFTIYPTTDCNARCFYCYELGRRRLMMSEETAHEAASFIAGRSGGEQVTLRWFGGEPLFNRNVIDIITGDLRKAGIPFLSKMISNGLLFDRETVLKARSQWNLKDIQITLDGTEEVYNRTKAYVGFEGSPYLQVMRNIELLLEEGVNVDIRLNMDRKNAGDLIALVDELGSGFGRYPGFHVYCALLRNWGARNAFSSYEEAITRFGEIQEKLVLHGIERKYGLSQAYSTVNCIADNDAAVTILPDGHLGKCEHESDTGFIGSLREGIVNKEAADAYKLRRDEIPACEHCRHYPGCITPKICADISEGCTELRRSMADFALKSKIINTYKAYRSKTEEEKN